MKIFSLSLSMILVGVMVIFVGIVFEIGGLSTDNELIYLGVAIILLFIFVASVCGYLEQPIHEDATKRIKEE